MPVLPVAEWMPDKPPLGGGSVVASGVLWGSSQSYTPLLGPVQSGSGPLPAVPNHALFAFDQYGNGWVFAAAGQPPHLYACMPMQPVWASNAVGPAWVDVTAGGASGGGFGSLEVRFAQFKNTMIAASQFSTPYAYTMATTLSSPNLSYPNAGAPTGSFAVLAQTGTAPAGAYICIANDFCILGSIYQSATLYPYRIQWSAFNDPTNWPTPGTANAIEYQSDYNDFDGSDGVIRGLCGPVLNASFLVFFETGVQAGTYVGPPNVFDFQRIAQAHGTQYPDSIIVVEGTAYYWSEIGFIGCDGLNCTPIGLDKVDRYVVDVLLSVDDFQNVTIGATYDPRFRTICWAFCNPFVVGGSTTFLFWHKDFNRWSYYTTSGYGYIVEGYYTASPSTANIYAMFSRPMATIDLMGNFANWVGAPVAAEVSTLEAQPVEGKWAFINGARLLSDAGTGGATVQCLTRYRLDDAQKAWPAAGINVAGDFPQRAEGRYVQALINIPANENWTHVEGIEPSFVESGAR